MIILVFIFTSLLVVSEASLSCANITDTMVIADSKMINMRTQEEVDYVPTRLTLGFVWQAGHFIIEGLTGKVLVIRDLLDDQIQFESTFDWRTYDYFFLLGDTVEDLHLYIGWARGTITLGKIRKFNNGTKKFESVNMTGWDAAEQERGAATLASIHGKQCLTGGAGGKTTVLCYNQQAAKWEEQGTSFTHYNAPSVAHNNRLYVCPSDVKTCHTYNLTSGTEMANAVTLAFAVHYYRMYSANNEVHIVGNTNANNKVSDCVLSPGFPRCIVLNQKVFQGFIQLCGNDSDEVYAEATSESNAAQESGVKAATNNCSGTNAWIGLMSGWVVVVFIAMLIVFIAYLMDRKKATCEKCGNEMQTKK